MTNPLILGLLSGLAYAQTGLGIAPVLKQTGSYISGLSLPLALLCTGPASICEPCSALLTSRRCRRRLNCFWYRC
ncbi:Uncharacterised protein [Serratia fonticola]|uniref:Uncharacterized protein n=1 Tax=Serratia fonticola TaxID=47917 RepID=A0A4U9WMR0_SERFO|nr:Uncharacterised protein [Serratia fonticola]